MFPSDPVDTDSVHLIRVNMVMSAAVGGWPMATSWQHPDAHRFPSLTDPTGVLIANGAALAVVLLHVLIDFHIGLYGPSAEVMTPAQAANAVRIAVTASGWMIALVVSMRGSRTGTACAIAFVVVWGLKQSLPIPTHALTITR